MLIVLRRARRIVHVPAILLAITAWVTCAAAGEVIERPGADSALGALLCVGLLALVFADVRVARGRERTLEIRTVFSHRSINLRRCALAVRVSYGAWWGTTYTVYATDGTVTADLSDHWNERRADDAAERFEELVPDSPDREELVRALAAQRREWSAAKRSVDAYYNSPAWTRGLWMAFTAVALFLVATFITCGVVP